MTEGEKQRGQDPVQLLRKLSHAGTRDELERGVEALKPLELIWGFSRLSSDEQVSFLTALNPNDAAGVIEELPQAQAAEAIEKMPASSAAAILSELPSDESADLVAKLEKTDAAAILAEMGREDAEIVQMLASYPAESAGGLMSAEVLSFATGTSVGAVVRDLSTRGERYSDFAIQYMYVINQAGGLVGVIPLRALLLSTHDVSIEKIMIRGVESLPGNASLEELRNFFDMHPYLAAPVVDQLGRLLGVVRRDQVLKAIEAKSDSDHLRMQGVVEEEFRSMPLRLRAGRRLAWLSGNIILNLCAAGVIAAFEDTLKAVIALTVFMPIISDMSGCAGSQAVAVSMRELALGLLKPREVMRVFWKELGIGVVNGLVLGLIVAGIAVLWQGNPWFGLVVGGALAANTVVAVIFGGIIPLLLKLIGKDPALASGPLLTTITDMAGFFLMLSLATLLLPRL